MSSQSTNREICWCAASRLMLDTCTIIIVELHPPLFICMVDVKSLHLQQTCIFSLSIVLVTCSCNLSMELSRTFFSYISFCDCHLLLITICNEVNFPPTCYAHHVRITTVRERAQQLVWLHHPCFLLEDSSEPIFILCSTSIPCMSSLTSLYSSADFLDSMDCVILR